MLQAIRRKTRAVAVLDKEITQQYLLADEKHIDRAEVEVVEEGECGQPVVGRVLAGVKLRKRSQVWLRSRSPTVGRWQHTMIVFPLYWMI